jgi:hypothetical protein
MFEKTKKEFKKRPVADWIKIGILLVSTLLIYGRIVIIVPVMAVIKSVIAMTYVKEKLTIGEHIVGNFFGHNLTVLEAMAIFTIIELVVLTGMVFHYTFPYYNKFFNWCLRKLNVSEV